MKFYWAISVRAEGVVIVKDKKIQKYVKCSEAIYIWILS